MKKIFYGISKDMSFLADNKKERLEYLIEKEGKSLIETLEEEKGIRTLPQNDSLHLWCEQVAKELNESGQTLQKVLAKTVEIDWTKDLVKTILWKSVQKAITQKESTTELSKVGEIDAVYEHLNRFLAQKCNGIHIPFPNKELLPKVPMPEYPVNDKVIDAF